MTRKNEMTVTELVMEVQKLTQGHDGATWLARGSSGSGHSEVMVFDKDGQWLGSVHANGVIEER